jgi:hypothetical protein
MPRRLGTVFAWCAALLVTTLSAQDRQIGSVGIAIYEDVNLLRDFGFDNRIVSVRPVGARPR